MRGYEIDAGKLFEAMKQAGIKSFRELSRKSGVTPQTICSIVNGKHRAYSSTLLKLAAALQTTVDYLIKK